MKRFTLFLFFSCVLLLGSPAAIAQDSRTQERAESVEAAKIAFLTDKMELTAEQAQKFWPLYNEYENKRRALIKGYRSGYRQDVDALSDQEAKSRIDSMFITKEKELQLEKEYATKYRRVISDKQLIKLYRGERDFTKMLLKRLDDKRAGS